MQAKKVTANEETQFDDKLLAPLARTSFMSRAFASLWAARGFFGGAVALGLAFYGQYTLIEKRDDITATQYYAAAVALLILSQLRFSRKPRQAKGNQVASTGIVETRATVEETPSISQIEPIVETDPNLTTQAASPIEPARRPVVPYDPDLNLDERAKTGLSNDTAENTSVRVSVSGRYLRVPSVLRTTWLWAALTLVLVIASTVMLVNDISSPLSGWLWAATLLVMLITASLVKDPDVESTLLPGPQDDFINRGRPGIPVRWEAVIMAVILGVALAARLYNLETHPLYFGDEGERGLEGRAINEGVPHPIFGFGWWSVPNLYFYCVAWLLRIFGDNMVGDRMICVISGMLMVWFIYRIARLLWGPRAGLLAGAMLAASPLALQFSRSASESTPTGALWTIGFYFLFMALRYRRWSDWVLAGFGWGFSLYFYASSKLIVPLAVVVGLYCLLRWRKEFFRQYALGFAVTAVAMWLVFMPNAIFSIQDNWFSFTQRAQEMSITSKENQPILFSKLNLPYEQSWANQPFVQSIQERPITWAQAFIGQTRATLEVIYKRHDGAEYYRNDLYHNGTMMQPLWAALTMLGLAFAVWKFSDARYGLSVIWLWGGMLGAILTIDTPTVQRMTGSWSVVMLFPALLADRIFAGAWPLSLNLARRWASVPLAALVIYFAADAYQEYFVHYPSFYPKFWNTYALYAKELGQDYKAYQLPHEFGGRFDYGVVRFVAKGIEGTTVQEPVDYLPISDNNNKGVVFIVLPQTNQYLHVIRQFYPGGQEDSIMDRVGNQQFIAYKLTREQMVQSQTLRVTYSPQDGQPIDRNEPNIGTANVGSQWTPPDGLVYPARAAWEGGLVAPKFGVYTLQIVGGQDARLELDGKTVLEMDGSTVGTRQINVVLAKGIHDVSLTGTLFSPMTRVELLWTSPGRAARPIPASYLFDGPTGGISGEAVPKANPELLAENDPYGGLRALERRSYPTVGFRDLGNPFNVDPPALLRWQGRLKVPTSGSYGFDLISNGAAALMIDGKSILNSVQAAGERRNASGDIELTAGEHSVDIRYSWAGGGALIEWYWRPPNQEHVLVPPDALIPQARSWSPEEVAAPSNPFDP